MDPTDRREGRTRCQRTAPGDNAPPPPTRPVEIELGPVGLRRRSFASRAAEDHPKQGHVRAPLRFRSGWALALAGGSLLAWTLWRPAESSRAAAASSGFREGALEELANARLEQALIRAETTARLLHLLEERSGGAGGP